MLLTMAIMLAIYGPISAQSLTPVVYASAGSHYTNSTGQMSYTIGEPLTSSYTNTTMVTQGFHQPEQNSSGVHNNPDFVFTVYPNPSTGYISIVSNNPAIEEFGLELINNLGQILMFKNISGNMQEVNVSELAPGTYHLRITYMNNQSNSFTIIKTTNQ